MCRGRRALTMGTDRDRAHKENAMFLIHVKLIDGVFTGPQKQEFVERLTDAVVATAGESMRQSTWCLLEDIAGSGWGIGGQTLTLDDVRALARGNAAEG